MAPYTKIITETDVDDILKTVDTSKATGPDMLNPRLLKEASSILKYPLCKLFNLSLSTSIFPTESKFANVTPVFKKDSPCNVKNYRPISLISIIGKIMEIYIYKIFTITYWQIASLLHTNLALLGVIQLLINFYS